MRILICTDRMGLGGAETHIALLCRGLLAHGHEVSLLSCGGESAVQLQADGVKAYRFPALSRHPFALFRAQAQLLSVMRKELPQVIHAHARLPALLLQHPAVQNSGARRVVTAHARFSGGKLLSRVCYWGERTIAVSEDLRAHLYDRFGVPAEQITVIPNGIDKRLFFPPQSPPRAHTLLFASRMDADCALGAQLLCRLYPLLRRRFSDLRLTLAGGGAALPGLLSLSRALKLPLLPPSAALDTALPGVCFAGGVSDMPPLYRAHRAFVGVSRAAMEAAACGCQVILCGNEGFSGAISPADPLPALTNFCCRGEPLPTASRLYAAIVQLLSSPPSPPFSVPSASDMLKKTLAVYG